MRRACAFVSRCTDRRLRQAISSATPCDRWSAQSLRKVAPSTMKSSYSNPRRPLSPTEALRTV